jgi:hypothetical protein
MPKPKGLRGHMQALGDLMPKPKGLRGHMQALG